MKRDGIAAPLTSSVDDPGGAITAPPPAGGASGEQLDDRQDSVKSPAGTWPGAAVSEHRDAQPATPSQPRPPVTAPERATDLVPNMATGEIMGRVADAAPEGTASPLAEPDSGDAPPRLWLRGRVGRAIPSLRSGRSQLAAVVGVGLVLLVGSTGFLAHEIAGLTDQLRATAAREDAQIAALRSDLDIATGSLGDQIARIAGRADDQLDSTVVTREVAPSVYEVQAGDSVGTAWVVASSRGASQLITNAHVVAHAVDAGQTTVTVTRGPSTLHATVGNIDREADLAMLSVSQELPALGRGTGEVAVGSPVLVVGSALGLEGSVSSGVVSAIRQAGGHDYLQVSAPVNFGNSGGPVVDRHGQVIGVTVVKVVGDGAEGLAFAIPIATVCQTMIDCGSRQPSHLGGLLRPS